MRSFSIKSVSFSFAIQLLFTAQNLDANPITEHIVHKVYSHNSCLDQIRGLFEDVAFKIQKKMLWTVLGYNPDPSEMKIAGKKSITTKTRITFINGILNTVESAKNSAEMISNFHGGVSVNYLYVATGGITSDMFRGFLTRAGFTNSAAQILASEWKRLIKEMGGIEGGGKIIHYAHSLGGTDTSVALEMLSSEERKMIKVITFGSITMINPDSCNSALNYISDNDPVPYLDKQFKKALGIVDDGKSEIKTLASLVSTPYTDHLLSQPTYKDVLKDLGREFIKEHCIEESVQSYIPKSVPTFLYKKSLAHDVLVRVEDYIRHKHYKMIGQCIKEELGATISLTQLEQIANRLSFTPLQRALKASNKIINLSKHLTITEGEVVEIALFIETELSEMISDKLIYLSRYHSGLSKTVEYDPESKKTFIHLGSNDTSRVGEGCHKSVTKSILYDVEQPELVANCVCDHTNRREMNILRKLKNIPGVLESHALITHTREKTGRDKLEMIVKLYNHGSLYGHFARGTKFTEFEKLSIAYDLIQGLAGIHSRGYVHRDLHGGNLLLNIEEKQESKERIVKACIIDFGQAWRIDRVNGIPSQFARFSVSPEAYDYHDLKHDDYCATDIYALGCIFYNLFYDKRPPWFDRKLKEWMKDRQKERCRRYLISMLQEERNSKKQNFQDLNLSGGDPIKRFQNLIFEMVNPYPSKRKNAAMFRDIMKSIYNEYIQKR